MVTEDISFWFGLFFVFAGVIYVFNEILLGELVHCVEDLSWRIGEVVVWFGFTLGIVGYFRRSDVVFWERS